MSITSELTASISPTNPRSGLARLGRQLVRHQEAPVLARQADRAPAHGVEQADDLGVDLAGEHHLDDAHILGAGHALTVGELGLLTEPLERARDLGAAAVHDDGTQPRRLKQDDLLREAALERGIDHRGAAILDDRAFAREALDVAQGLDHRLAVDRTVPRRARARPPSHSWAMNNIQR